MSFCAHKIGGSHLEFWMSLKKSLSHIVPWELEGAKLPLYKYDPGIFAKSNRFWVYPHGVTSPRANDMTPYEAQQIEFF